MALPAFSASVLLLMKMPGALTLQGLFGFAEMSDQSLLRLWLWRRESMVSMQNTGFAVAHHRARSVQLCLAW